MNLKKLIQLLIFLSIGLFLVWFSVKDLNKEERSLIWSSLSGVNVWAVMAMFLIATLSHVARAVRWKIIAGEETEGVSVADYFFAIMGGYLANLAIPRLGEVTRCGLLNRYRKADFSKMLGTVLFERLFDVLCLGIVFLLTLAMEYKVFYPYALEQFINPLRQMLSPGILVVLLCGTAIGIMAVVFVMRRTMHAEHQLLVILNRFLKGLTGVMNLKKPGAFVLWTILIWFLYWAGIIAGYYAMESIGGLNWGSGLSLLIGGTIAMIVVQGGIGAYPYFISQILLLYSVAKPTGIAFGWLGWLIQTLVVLLWGFLAFLYFAVNKLPNEDAKS